MHIVYGLMVSKLLFYKTTKIIDIWGLDTPLLFTQLRTSSNLSADFILFLSIMSGPENRYLLTKFILARKPYKD